MRGWNKNSQYWIGNAQFRIALIIAHKALPINHDLEEGLKVWKEKAKIAAMDYCFHMAVTGWNDKVGGLHCEHFARPTALTSVAAF